MSTDFVDQLTDLQPFSQCLRNPDWTFHFSFQSSIPTRVSTVHSPLESISDQVPILPSFPESFNPEVNLVPPDIETLDDFDDEIKMIVERAERRTTSEESDDGLLSFLEEHGIETSIGDNAGLNGAMSISC